MSGDVKHGSCLCGAVRYTASGPFRPIWLCHCVQCRKTSGHFVAATACANERLAIAGDGLVWYQSSNEARRGFCGICGSSLFWQHAERGETSIHAGTIDGATGLSTGLQICTETQGDYYELPDVPVG